MILQINSKKVKYKCIPALPKQREGEAIATKLKDLPRMNNLWTCKRKDSPPEATPTQNRTQEPQSVKPLNPEE